MEYLNYTQCKVEHAGPDIYEVTIAIAMHSGPVNNASFVGTIVKSGYEDRKPLVEYKIDWCEFLRSKRRNFFAKFVYRILGIEQYSNINHSCPYDHDLTLDHYPFNGKAMAKVVPFGNGKFTFNTKWYTYNILRAVVNIRYQTFDR
ncbi:uncharacterized protein LOC128867043 [Anastrepha ludens]|uniref:uncharacterized protein LOC128867043 n=1 Tax=Anastrepha ludens TaxID=28586 RepID=UPI0023AEF30D|nr:uncharacterized protein LOC128867043 [Anastrepha ludens]